MDFQVPVVAPRLLANVQLSRRRSWCKLQKRVLVILKHVFKFIWISVVTTVQIWLYPRVHRVSYKVVSVSRALKTSIERSQILTQAQKGWSVPNDSRVKISNITGQINILTAYVSDLRESFSSGEVSVLSLISANPLRYQCFQRPQSHRPRVWSETIRQPRDATEDVYSPTGWQPVAGGR